MTTASRPLATALWGARFAGDWLPSCYTTFEDTASRRLATSFERSVGLSIPSCRNRSAHKLNLKLQAAPGAAACRHIQLILRGAAHDFPALNSFAFEDFSREDIAF